MPTPAFPRNFACGRAIEPDWIHVDSGGVTETLLHGRACNDEPGPARKKGYLICADRLPEPAR